MQTVDRVVADPQTASLDILHKTPDGRTTTVALPVSFDGRRRRCPATPPALGQHDALLADVERNFYTEES